MSEGPQSYPLGYVEGLNNARTMLTGCFSIRYYLLLPARRQDRLHLLTLLIDSRIPCEAGLLGKPRHCLNQLIPLRAQNHVAVPIWFVVGLMYQCWIVTCSVPPYKAIRRSFS